MNKFSHSSTSFSFFNAVALGQAALIAYEAEPTIAAAVDKWGMNNFRFITQKETQCFVAGDDKKIIVSFRGTEPNKLKDWATDAGIFLGPGPFGSVHQGFLGALLDVWPAVRDTLREFQDQAQSLWFTGHSLGAALATLAVTELRKNARPVYGLYTFGQPRVGDSEFERMFNMDFKSMCFRYANNNDVVTRVPLRTMGYRHVGNCLYFDHKGILRSDISYWWKFLDSVAGRVDDLGKLGPDAIKDHSMKTYLKLLRKNQDRKVSL